MRHAANPDYSEQAGPAEQPHDGDGDDSDQPSHSDPPNQPQGSYTGSNAKVLLYIVESAVESARCKCER